MNFSYSLYGTDCERISHEQVLAEQHRDGMLFARAEQSGSEGCCVEVARWSEARCRWERYAFHKFLDGDDPQLFSCVEAACHYAKEINQATSHVTTFLPIIHRMPDCVDDAEEGRIDEDSDDTESNVPCVACGRDDLPLHTNGRCGACGPGPVVNGGITGGHEIRLPCYGITICLDRKLSVKEPGSGTITSDLKQDTNAEDANYAEYAAAIDGLELLVLAHACAGIDVASPAYVEGIETAVDAIANNYSI